MTPPLPNNIRALGNSQSKPSVSTAPGMTTPAHSVAWVEEEIDAHITRCMPVKFDGQRIDNRVFPVGFEPTTYGLKVVCLCLTPVAYRGCTCN